MVPPEGAPGFAPYPKICGHEGAGIVESVGSGITHVKKGDKVLLSFDSCGAKETCRGCRDDTPGYCKEFHARNIFATQGVGKDEQGDEVAGLFFGQSSFSKMALVKSRSVLNVEGIVKDEEELKVLAPLGCGYQTGAGAVVEVGDVKAGDAVAVSCSFLFV